MHCIGLPWDGYRVIKIKCGHSGVKTNIPRFSLQILYLLCKYNTINDTTVLGLTAAKPLEWECIWAKRSSNNSELNS